MYRSQTGRYMLVAGRSPDDCAAVATLGSVDADVPFFLATVELIAGPAPNTEGIEV